MLELDDSVLEGELALLETLNEHLVGIAGGHKRVNGRVEIGVFLPLGGKFKAQLGLLFLAQR